MDAPLESIQRFRGRYFRNGPLRPERSIVDPRTILLDSASLHVGNPVLKEHIHGSDWMNEKYPTISFKLSKLENIRKKESTLFADAKGKMTIRNATIEMTAPIRITYLKGLSEKRNRVPGDLLVIRSKFIVKRDDFGIRAGENLEKVANQIEISLNVAGAAPSN